MLWYNLEYFLLFDFNFPECPINFFSILPNPINVKSVVSISLASGFTPALTNLECRNTYVQVLGISHEFRPFANKLNKLTAARVQFTRIV